MNKVIKLIYLVLLVQVVALVVVVSGFNKSTTSSDINKDGAVDALDLLYWALIFAIGVSLL